MSEHYADLCNISTCCATYSMSVRFTKFNLTMFKTGSLNYICEGPMSQSTNKHGYSSVLNQSISLSHQDTPPSTLLSFLSLPAKAFWKRKCLGYHKSTVKEDHIPSSLEDNGRSLSLSLSRSRSLSLSLSLSLSWSRWLSGLSSRWRCMPVS